MDPWRPMRGLVAGLYLVAGCGEITAARSADGVLRWSELRSPHFRLRTSATVDDAQRIIKDAERGRYLLDALFRSLVPGAPPLADETIELFVFTDAADKAALFPGQPYGGTARLRGNEPEPRPIIGVLADEDLHLVLWHELGHQIVSHYLPTAPVWLSEGFAELSSAVVVNDGQLVIGKWQDWLYSRGYQPNVKEAFVADQGVFHRGYYTEAYALVHLLSSEQREFRPLFLEYLQRVGNGMRADLAWRASFPGLDLDGLERLLNGHRLGGLHSDSWLIAVGALPEPAVTGRPIGFAEMRLIKLAFTPWTRARREALAREVAYAEEKGGRDAMYWAALWKRDWDTPAAAEAALERALDADGDNPRLLHVAVESRPALWPKLRELAQTPTERAEAAVWLSHAGAPAEALALARRATADWPWSAGCWRKLAYVAQRAGGFAEAATALQRVAALTPERAEPLLAMRRLRCAARHRSIELPAPAMVAMPARVLSSLELRGQLVTSDGHGAPGFIHAQAGDRFDVVRTDDNGNFRVALGSGLVRICALPDDEGLLADVWERQVAPASAPVALGQFAVVRGAQRDVRVAVDGLDPVSLDGKIVVAYVAAGSAAAAANIHAGDVLVEIDGQRLDGLGHEAANLLLEGDLGRELAVHLQRGGVDITKTLRLKAPFEGK